MGKFLSIVFMTVIFSVAPAFAQSSTYHPAPTPEPAPAPKLSVICESHGGYVECETGVEIANPEIKRQLSTEACTFGGSWGYYETRVWVNHGCRAKFSFEDANAPVPEPTPVPTPAPTPVPPPAPRPPQHTVDCRWNNYNWQPFNKIAGFFIGRTNYGFQGSDMCVYTVQLSRDGAVCNWNGIGFTSYNIMSNAEVVPYSYASIEACYAALPR